MDKNEVPNRVWYLQPFRTHTMVNLYILVISSKGVKIKNICINMVTIIYTNTRLELFYNGRRYIYFCVLRLYGHYVVPIRHIHPTD
jgi:hypothetical protein